MPTNRQYASLAWLDIQGNQRTQFLHTLSNGVADMSPLGGVPAALQACSTSGLYLGRMSPSIVYGNVPGTGPFKSVLDYAKLQMRSAAGELVDVNIPAPLPGLFTFPGGDRLDLTVPVVESLIAALIVSCASASGSPLVEGVRGRRLRVRR